MIGIIVVSHGDLACALKNSAEMLIGKTKQIAYLGIYPNDSPDKLSFNLIKCIEEVEAGQGTIILVDLLGGTPCNVVASLSHNHHVRIVTGVNLPMLIQACTKQSESITLQEMLESLLTIGQDSIAEFQVSTN